MFEAILTAIKEFDTIIIHRHNRPDGDALGSQIGMKHLILENFPGKTVYTVGDEARFFGFMADSVMDEISDSVYEGALAIILDTASRPLISDDRYTLAAKTVRMVQTVSRARRKAKSAGTGNPQDVENPAGNRERQE